jgi:peptidoglycan-N-acetylglucosamine deacetylase
MPKTITTLFTIAIATIIVNAAAAQEQKVRTPYLPNWGQVPLEQMEAQVVKFGGTAYVQGKEDQKVVALTYDDGPSLDTPALLDVLKRHNVKATFFWMGQHVNKNPKLVKRAMEEGHTLGNHSWNHPYLNKEPQGSYWKPQIENTQSVYEKRIGKKPRFFRPPYGYLNDNQVQDFADRV